MISFRRGMDVGVLGVGTLALALLAGPGAAFGEPHDWAEGTAAADDGATRDFYNRGASLAWRNLMGDWVDAAGAEQGATAFATTTVDDTDSARYVEWDVAALVQAWLDGDFDNQGFFLRATSTGRNIIFRAREHATPGERPELVVDTGSGPVTLAPEADTYLPESTYHCQGEEDQISIGAEANAMLRFDLSSLGEGASVSSARLRLFTTTQYDSIVIGVFRVAPGRQGPPPALDVGIAADYEDDDGIEGHADVLFFDDFEAADWLSGWTGSGGTFEAVDADPDRGFLPLLGRALRVTVPHGENLGLSLTYDFMDEVGEEPEEIYLRYYLRFGSTWDPSDGGKLPGISGTYGVAGWGGRPSDGTNGWSSRGLFRPAVPAGDNPLSGYTPIGSYVYHADMEGTYGDNYIWLDGWGAEGYGGLIDRNRWYCLEVFVRMNTPTQNDGVIRAWVDGRLSVETEQMRFRDVATLLIERIWMNVYHGGSATAPQDLHLYIDNVVVARSYVGPMDAEPVVDPDGDADVDADTDADSDADADVDADVDADADADSDADGSGDADGEGDGQGEGGCSCSAPGEAPSLWAWGPAALLLLALRGRIPRR